ncbi:MAG: MBL fold metallo-hydrolase [Candidatus Thioglobus sp.]|nr:MBL fold metallo-hydrolase [Candidatus Thioglobus sp.]
MKKIIFLIIFSFSTLINAWIIENVGTFKFEKISPKVWIMHGPKAEPNQQNQGFMNNPGLVVGATGLVVIDPGSSYLVGKRVLAEIEKISKKPIKAIFNTHIHGDHWLGNQALIEKYPAAKIYAHPNMIFQAKDGGAASWIKIMQDLTKGAAAGTIATYPTDSTSHLQIISVAGEQFKIHNPTKKSHTDTDIMIEHIGSKTLFLGDNDFVNRQGRFDNSANMHGNIQVLQYALALKLSNYVPGHGASGDAKSAVQPFLSYLLTVQTEVKKGYENDLADYEIKPLAAKKLSAYRHWHGFQEQLGRHISKMLLEVEALDL